MNLSDRELNQLDDTASQSTPAFNVTEKDGDVFLVDNTETLRAELHEDEEGNVQSFNVELHPENGEESITIATNANTELNSLLQTINSLKWEAEDNLEETVENYDKENYELDEVMNELPADVIHQLQDD